MPESIQHILKILEVEGTSSINWDRILSETLKTFECTTGSIHALDPLNNTLHIKASQGIPEFLLLKMSLIPVGKGMAGVAALRLEPVQMCNLQTDDSGIARPSAKETKVEGAIAAPIMFEGKLYGTLGIAKSIPYDFTEDEINSLMKIGERIAMILSRFHDINHRSLY
ncbi:MAG: GAF domain-containing protein [Bacteroidota bacterium]|nr:GAF domain-containing protein [Bacteroidota bacterium]